MATLILERTATTKATAAMAPRDRILAAAQALFYARGIRAVSVDEIAAAARTNKMTLYRHYESKDLLVAEYVRALAAEADAFWDNIADTHPGDPLAQLRAWVDGIGASMTNAGARGCAVANAAVEIAQKDHPARAIIEEHKNRQRDRLVQCCRDAGFLQPDRLADEIFLLMEGARINVQSVGSCGPGSRFAAMVCALIHSHERTQA
jgi:AcrR family transcriptional regulator